MTDKQRALLGRLFDAPSGIKSEDLTIGERRLVTVLQRDGLVVWRAPAFMASRHSLKGQIAFITDAGRVARGDGH